MNQAQDKTLGNLSQVIVNKDSLINIIKVNREKHQQIYEAACSGFWLEAQDRLEEKKTELREQHLKSKKSFAGAYKKDLQLIADRDPQNIPNLESYFPQHFYPSLGLTYPTQHFDDYDRSISMLTLSVADNISLSLDEHEKYVRNNWSWRNDFVTSSRSYVTKAYSGIAGNSEFLNGFIASGSY